MATGTKPYVGEVVKITNFQDYFSLTAAAAAKIIELIAIVSGDGTRVQCASNASINGSLSDYANFPLNSVIISISDSKTYVKAAAAGTSTWKYITLS